MLGFCGYIPQPYRPLDIFTSSVAVCLICKPPNHDYIVHIIYIYIYIYNVIICMYNAITILILI